MKTLIPTLTAATLALTLATPAHADNALLALGQTIQASNDLAAASNICNSYTLPTLPATEDVPNLLVSVEGVPGAVTAVVKNGATVVANIPIPSTTVVPLPAGSNVLTVDFTCPASTANPSMVMLQAQTAQEIDEVFVKTTGGAFVSAVSKDGAWANALAAGNGVAVLPVSPGKYRIRVCKNDACVWSGQTDADNAQELTLTANSPRLAKVRLSARPTITGVSTTAAGKTVISGANLGSSGGFVQVVRPDGTVTRVIPKNSAAAGRNWTETAVTIATPALSETGKDEGTCVQVFAKYGGYAETCAIVQ